MNADAVQRESQCNALDTGTDEDLGDLDSNSPLDPGNSQRKAIIGKISLTYFPCLRNSVRVAVCWPWLNSTEHVASTEKDSMECRVLKNKQTPTIVPSSAQVTLAYYAYVKHDKIITGRVLEGHQVNTPPCSMQEWEIKAVLTDGCLVFP